MNEFTKNTNGYVGYEYANITVSKASEALYLDNYRSFGWALESVSTSLGGASAGLFPVTMKFKRDRRISNKAELVRLQRQFDALTREIMMLEQSKTTSAQVAGYGIGLVGTAFMAGSVFAFLGGMPVLCAVLAVPAFAGWGLSYLSYVKLRGSKTRKLDPIIGQKYDEMYDVCEKASSLAY